jgi:hypothetical protein
MRTGYYVYKSIGYMAMKLILSREYFRASTFIHPALTMNKLILNYKIKEEEKEELLLFGHKGSHIRLKKLQKSKDL